MASPFYIHQLGIRHPSRVVPLANQRIWEHKCIKHYYIVDTNSTGLFTVVFTSLSGRDSMKAWIEWIEAILDSTWMNRYYTAAGIRTRTHKSPFMRFRTMSRSACRAESCTVLCAVAKTSSMRCPSACRTRRVRRIAGADMFQIDGHETASSSLLDWLRNSTERGLVALGISPKRGWPFAAGAEPTHFAVRNNGEGNP